jgi:hypothetical protein
MQPANTSPGTHEYTLTVKYTDPEPREVQLVFKVTIPEMLWVTPPFMGFYHPKGSSPTHAEFTVTDGRGKRFDITDVSINTDLVQTAIGEPSRTETGNYQYKVKILVEGNLPPGMTQHILKITTTDPDFSELRVPIRLEGEAVATETSAEANLDHEADDANTIEDVPARKVEPESSRTAKE